MGAVLGGRMADAFNQVDEIFCLQMPEHNYKLGSLTNFRSFSKAKNTLAFIVETDLPENPAREVGTAITVSDLHSTVAETFQLENFSFCSTFVGESVCVSWEKQYSLK